MTNDPGLQRLGNAEVDMFRALRGRLEHHLQALPDKPEETADSTLRCLWHLAAGNPLSPGAAAEKSLDGLSAEMQSSLLRLVEQRISGVPLGHLCGRQRFMGLELFAGPQALIPRHETELLAQAVIATLRHRVLSVRGQATVVDTCTGCGNLAVAIASADPRVRVLASDLSAAAVELARRNVEHHRLGGQIELRVGDLLQPFDEPSLHRAADIIVCNPPYISSKKLETMPGEIIGFEPRLAFDGGPLGVRILQRLIREAPALLRDGGWLMFEVGLGQGEAVMQRVARSGDYVEVSGVNDAAGQVRAVMARSAAPTGTPK
jgi:release factor glutamine methyltransferase